MSLCKSIHTVLLLFSTTILGSSTLHTNGLSPQKKHYVASSIKRDYTIPFYKEMISKRLGCSVKDLDKVIWIESRHNPQAYHPSYIGILQMNKAWCVSKGMDTLRLKTDYLYNLEMWNTHYVCKEVEGKLSNWKEIRRYQRKPSKVKAEMKLLQ